MPRRIKAFYSDHFDLPLPADHRFPMAKYRLLRERVANGALGTAIDLRVPEAASDQQLLRVHHRLYLEKLVAGTLAPRELRRIGFPWSPQMVERSRRSTGATLAAARAALLEGIGVNLAGGTHHAFPSGGQGFCVFNDVAVTIRVLQSEGQIERAVIIDCDVHQGNGTAAIFAGDACVFTFSMHGEKNFPFTKCDGDLDVPLADGTTDEEYLAILDQALSRLPLEETDSVYYLAGADPFQQDRLGRLGLTKDGLAARDRMVLSTCRDLEVPTVVLMAGGYASHLSDIVDIHARTVEVACEVFAPEMRQHATSLG